MSKGTVVSARHWIPDEAFDFEYTAEVTIGCSRLRCTECGEPVRQQPGLSVNTYRQDFSARALYAQSSWEGLLGTEPSASHRFYLCACTAWNETATTCQQDVMSSPPRPCPPPWLCAGHPPLPLPSTLDGEALSHDMDLRALVARRISRTGPLPAGLKGLRDDDVTRRTFWLLRLFALLEGSDVPALAPQLTRAIAEHLVDPDPVARRTVFRIFRLVPHGTPGDERLAPLALAHPELFSGEPDEQLRESMELELLVAMQRRWDLAEATGQPIAPESLDAALRTLAHREARGAKKGFTERDVGGRARELNERRKRRQL